ncbi:MAG: hypothetical protein IID40_03860 [Planctomycetes bacterium]|nr:hypothetical protein [Planctomycetota bacterium]
MKWVAAAAVFGGALGATVRAGDDVVEGFVAYVQESDRYDVSAKAFLVRQWEERRTEDDTDAFLLEGLAVLSDEFRAGLAAFEEDRFADCARVMVGLTAALDPYLSANAAVYEIKALVAGEALPEAEARIDALTALPARLERFSHSAAEMGYLKGYCALGELRYADASRALMVFLERFPEAPQRLRMSATQILAELRTRVPERLGEVTDLMDYAGRRLANRDTGSGVQQRQQEVIELLDKLIEEAEQQEQSSSSSSGAQGSPQPRPSGGRTPQSPMDDSMVPQGRAAAPQGEPGSRQTVRPGEVWGAMRPADRERVIQALKDRFPARYRQLVEQYYEELAKKP